MLTNPTIHTDVARLHHADVLDEAARAHRAGAGGRDRRSGRVLRLLIAQIHSWRGPGRDPASDLLPEATPVAKRVDRAAS